MCNIRRQDEDIALKSSLLSNYDKSLRPVKSASTAVNVDFDISLKQIIELAEKEQTFQINIWLRLYWDDEYLTWNASEHGVESLTIHSSDVWRPDIFLYNNIAKTYGAIEPITDVTVTSAGRVSHLQPAIFTSACPVDISRFPFDKQECILEFGSWIHSSSKVNISLVKSTADRAVFTQNVEWILNGALMERKEDIFPCCPEPFVTILLTMQLERRTFFYMFNMVLPCIVLMILNVFGFCIPPDTGKRLAFFMTILLALVVFQKFLSDSLPKTSTAIPQLGQFFAATIALVGFSCLASIVVIRMSYNSPPSRPLPRWLRLPLLRYLARLFCMNTISEEKHMVPTAKEGVYNVSDRETTQQKDAPNLTLELSLREIVIHTREYTAHARETKVKKDEQDEWKMAALVLDRALMFLVGLATIIVCVVLLR
ncbi:CHRNA10 [Branchiostoma lanceolatum]|uniref:CHRNA10 protein n=1 Tax=Branchiostoma lanceolatum TaxID=7740 RepID=A0A8K0AGK8_BRALA|nr:CHRNA10 [Branchiostoma lanceolatum]